MRGNIYNCRPLLETIKYNDNYYFRGNGICYMKKVKVSRSSYIFCSVIEQSKTIAYELREGIGHF